MHSGRQIGPLGTAARAVGGVIAIAFPSMLVAAARGFGGCEALAIPNVLSGRGDQVGCPLFTPIDAAESRRRTRSASPA